MKTILFLISFLAVTATYGQESQVCLSETKAIVTEQEVLWAGLFGPIQGDYLEDSLSVEQTIIKEDSVTYTLSAEHTNEDGEFWYNNYSVSLLKEGCYLESYKFLGSEEVAISPDGGICVSQEQAEKNLKEFFKGSYNSIPKDWFYWLDEGDEGEDCLLYTSPSPRDQRGSRMPSSA